MHPTHAEILQPMGIADIGCKSGSSTVALLLLNDRCSVWFHSHEEDFTGSCVSHEDFIEVSS